MNTYFVSVVEEYDKVHDHHLIEAFSKDEVLRKLFPVYDIEITLDDIKNFSEDGYYLTYDNLLSIANSYGFYFKISEFIHRKLVEV